MRKLKQIKVKICGYYLWKDVDPGLALNQVINDKTVLKNEDELLQYMSDLMAKPFDENFPMWEMRFMYLTDEDKSVAMFKTHHSFTDGLGMISLMSCFDDDQFT